jgi:hypothetical protein
MIHASTPQVHAFLKVQEYIVHTIRDLFVGNAQLPHGAKLWSKAGWTSETRHDAAYVELPDGRKFVLVTFTANHADEREIIPHIAREILAGINAVK